MVIKLGDNLDHFINVKVHRERLRRWVLAAAFICLFVGAGLGYWWAYNSAHCNQKLIPDNCVVYCRNNGTYIEKMQ